MSTELTRNVAGVSLETQSHYVIKRRFWSFFERVFRVFTGDGQLIMYIQHPLLKLREEFMVYADEAKTQPLLRVKSQQVIAINFSYEVMDAQTGQVLGAVQKRGLRSIITISSTSSTRTAPRLASPRSRAHRCCAGCFRG